MIIIIPIYLEPQHCHMQNYMVHLSTIIRSEGWASEKTFAKFYDKKNRRSRVPKIFTKQGLIYCYISLKYITLYGVIYSELLVIYLDNKPDGTAMNCHKIKLSDLGFQACCEIFIIISRSLQSKYRIMYPPTQSLIVSLKDLIRF